MPKCPNKRPLYTKDHHCLAGPCANESLFLLRNSVCVEVCPSTFYKTVGDEKKCIDTCQYKTLRREDINVIIEQKTVTVANFECMEKCSSDSFLNRSLNECVTPKNTT